MRAGYRNEGGAELASQNKEIQDSSHPTLAVQLVESTCVTTTSAF